MVVGRHLEANHLPSLRSGPSALGQFVAGRGGEALFASPGASEVGGRRGQVE